MVQKNNQKTEAEPLEIIHTKLELQAEKAAKHRDYHKQSHKPKSHHSYITNKIKNERYKETLSQTRSEMSKIEAVFSKFIHVAFIYDFGELVSKTIVRPVTILINTLVTLILGIAIVTWGRRVGLDYPNTIFIAIFIAAYPFSLLFDIFVSVIKKRK